MNKKHFLPAFIIFATILLTSCSSRQYVIYSVNNITLPPETAKTIPINVTLRILTDNRVNIESNKILYTNNSRDVTIDNKVFCINIERDYIYGKEAVVNQITQMMVKHFNKAKLFANTSYIDESNYYLTGTLTHFYGIQKLSGEAVGLAVTADLLFGIVGRTIAISETNFKSPGKIVIEISDLKLFKNDGTLIKDFGNFFKEYTGNFPTDANCKCIYENVNTKLKEFNTELIEKIRNELIDVNF